MKVGMQQSMSYNYGRRRNRLRKGKRNKFILSKITIYKSSNISLAEHITANKVLQLLKMANSRVHGMYNIEQNIEKHRWIIANLRKTKQKELLELASLHNKISSANGMLKQYNLAIKEKKEELATILDKKIKYERQFKK
jgi:hypothetical protein